MSGDPGNAQASLSTVPPRPKRVIDFDLYDAFTTERFRGNPAGVVLLDEPLATASMQQVAAELGAPTTGFAVTGESLALRYFTPTREIDACGHVTLAIATALIERQAWTVGEAEAGFRLQTPAGEVPIRCVRAEGRAKIYQTYRPKLLTSHAISRGDVEASLGQVRSDRLLPLEILSTGLRHLLVPFRDTADLSRLTQARTAIGDLARRVGFETLCAFAPLPEGNVIRMRDLCGAIGVLEEPASGTTSAALGHYLFRHGRWIRHWPIVVEQGIEMGRPSRIEVSVERDADTSLVRVAGYAVRTVSGSVLLDD